MSKARGAMSAAKDLIAERGEERDAHGLPPLQVEDEFRRLLAIATAQAAVSQAESLAILAEKALEK